MKVNSRKIVVLVSGWVVVGDYTPFDTSIHLTNSSVIRRWGTEGGLGQLALEGATAETVLEPCGSLMAPMASVIMVIDVIAKGF